MANEETESEEATKSHRWIERIEQLTGSRALYPALFGLSFLESTVLPIPLEIILIPVFLLHRERIWPMALAVYLGCLAGASTGYGIGMWFYDQAGRPLIEWFGWESDFKEFSEKIRSDGFVPLFTVAVSPVPFQLAQIAAGAARSPFLQFLLASALARAIRYFGLAALIALFGKRAEEFLKTHERALQWGTLVVAGVVLAAWIAAQFLSKS